MSRIKMWKEDQTLSTTSPPLHSMLFNLPTISRAKEVRNYKRCKIIQVNITFRVPVAPLIKKKKVLSPTSICSAREQETMAAMLNKKKTRVQHGAWSQSIILSKDSQRTGSLFMGFQETKVGFSYKWDYSEKPDSWSPLISLYCALELNF